MQLVGKELNGLVSFPVFSYESSHGLCPYKLEEIPLRRPLVTALNEQTEKMQVDSTCTYSHQLRPQQAAYAV